MAFGDEILKAYTDLRNRLNEASGKWGGVQILPVTKTVEPERILVLKQSGVTAIGENRVQEAMTKIEKLDHSFDIHIIGRMQTNKARYAVKFAKMVESVDRPELALALDRACEREGRALDILIEVNIGNDPAKAGVSDTEAPDFFRMLSQYKNLSVKGLMTVAPIVETPEDARPYFRQMRKLFDFMRSMPGGESMNVLSMGMSGDCIVAAEEGATSVRVGSKIFGKRVYDNASGAEQAR